MTPRYSEIFTPQEIATGIHFHAWHGTETTLLFLPADGEAFCPIFPSLISLPSGGTAQPGNTYFCILNVTGYV